MISSLQYAPDLEKIELQFHSRQQQFERGEVGGEARQVQQTTETQNGHELQCESDFSRRDCCIEKSDEVEKQAGHPL